MVFVLSVWLFTIVYPFSLKGVPFSRLRGRLMTYHNLNTELGRTIFSKKLITFLKKKKKKKKTKVECTICEIFFFKADYKKNEEASG